jgi:tRNA pseudouridine55 synthase
VSLARRGSKRSSRRSRRVALSLTESPAPDGVLLVDKPSGFTSHDIVAIARGVIATRRIGHTGTLDPFATGLLVLLVGQATRLAQFVDGEPKVYEATFVFGTETDTDDATGAVVRDAPLPAPHSVDLAIASLTGALEQIPPDYSAKQSGGVRAYDAARKGRPLDLPASRVVVHRWTVAAHDGSSLSARIECSGGTYIRSLGRDLGRRSDSAAHVSALRRVSSGRFSVAEACSLDALRARQYSLLEMRSAIASLPTQSLSTDELGRVAHGNPVSATVPGDRAALVAQDGKLAAIALRIGDTWQPTTVFPQ